MVFVILEKDKPEVIMLVTASDLEQVKKRIVFNEGTHIVGTFTDAELDILQASRFAVVSVNV